MFKSDRKPRLVSKLKVARENVGRINPNSDFLEKARGNLSKHVFITTVVPCAQSAVTGETNRRL